ncbi:transposase [Streptomyces olindensis]|uniref:transposase n=1 Tax=Streptomyces olindensis TaxID=358823 RepID=UPI0033FBF588
MWSADGTIVRAHQHAAGARTEPSSAPTSKGDAAAEHQGETPWLSLIVTPGQRADCAQVKLVVGKTHVPRIGPGRPRKKPDSLAADKAYSSGPCRECLRHMGVRAINRLKLPDQWPPAAPVIWLRT